MEDCCLEINKKEENINETAMVLSVQSKKNKTLLATEF